MTAVTLDLNQIIVPSGQSVLLQDISWQKFESILAGLGQNRASKLFYDQGLLEIMVPLPEHEYFKEAIGDLIKDLADELGLEYESCGSTTWKRQQRMAGAEPDSSRVKFKNQTQCLADKGYQGIQKLHPNSRLPKKKRKGKQLSPSDLQMNRDLERVRGVCERIKGITEGV